MAKTIDRSGREAKPWSPTTVVLAMTAGLMALVGLFHLIIRIAAASEAGWPIV